MSQDFDNFLDDYEEEEEPNVVTVEDEVLAGEEDEFDRLRRKSARSETMDDDLAFDEELPASSSDSGFSLSNFSSMQRLVLAILVLLDILAIGFALLVITGRFS
jgi:hypothetical protein